MAVLQNMTWRFNNLRDIFRQDRKGWIICMCVLVLTVIRSGITYSFGVFIVKLESEFHRPMVEQNWIGTLSFCISLSCAPISVAFIRALRYRGYKLGGIIGTVTLAVSCMSSSFIGWPEWMFLTHSLLYGVGSSLTYMASSLVIGEYFDNEHRYHVLATSILLCGYPIGSLLFNPLNAFLVNSFGWRLAFRIAAIMIAIIGIPCCLTFSSKNEPRHERLMEEPDEADFQHYEQPLAVEEEPPAIPRRCCTMQEIKERPEIMLWYFGNMLSYLGFYMPFVNLAYYMQRKGIHVSKSSWALTLLSLAECTTYIIASVFGDHLKGKLVYINVLASAALSVICIIWPFVDVSYEVILVISMAMGGFLGLAIVYTYAASGEVTKLPIDIAWSFTNLWSGMGILIGPFFSGAIFDLRNSYDDVFYVVGALYVIDALCFGAIPFMDTYRAMMGIKLTEPYEDMDAARQQHTETFRITKKSLSKSSLANGDAGENLQTGQSIESYGTTGSTQPPPKPPPPAFKQDSFGNEGRPGNPFKGSSGPPPYNAEGGDGRPGNPFTRQDSGSSRPPRPPTAPQYSSGYGHGYNQ